MKTFTFDVWTLVGIAAQALFFSRFILQWYISEKKGYITVPIVFWVLSLLGALLLISYALVRRDIVFIIAGILQVILYSRNFILARITASEAQEEQGLLSPFLKHQRYLQVKRFILPTDRVLDIGCGAGDLRKHLSEQTAYFGIDIEQKWDKPSAHLFVTKSNKGIPKQIQKEQISVITALALIEHLKQPSSLFHQAKMVLPINGRLVLTTPHPIGRNIHDFGAKLGIFSSEASEQHEAFLNKESLIYLAQSEGFEILLYQRFLFGLNQIAVFRRIA